MGELNHRFSGKTITITGICGFIGSNLAYYFSSLNDSNILKKSCNVVGIDNLGRGFPKWLESHRKRDDFKFRNFDITEVIDFGESDFIIHGASIASPTYYRKKPIETMDANVGGIRNILEYCMGKKIESILFFSTSEIYGDPTPDNIPTSENYRGNVSCTGPRACYDESKRYGETLCVNFWREHAVPVKVVRPFNNYGPGLKISDKRIIPDFFRDILSNRDIVLFSDGSPSRTYCYILDAVEGYVRTLLSDFDGESFNIGSESPEISVKDIANKMIKLFNPKLNLDYAKNVDKEYNTDNPIRRCPSIKKAQSFLNFYPKIGIEEGLKRTFEFYKDNLEGTNN